MLELESLICAVLLLILVLIMATIAIALEGKEVMIAELILMALEVFVYNKLGMTGAIILGTVGMTIGLCEAYRREGKRIIRAIMLTVIAMLTLLSILVVEFVTLVSVTFTLLGKFVFTLQSKALITVLTIGVILTMFMLLGMLIPITEKVVIEHFTESKSEYLLKMPLIVQLLKIKNAESYITYISLCVALAVEYALYKTAPISEMSMQWTLIFTTFLLISSFIKQRILNYRVSHGLYGTCYSEAKEIIAFILEWQRKNGDSNRKPPKLVFTQEELDQCLQVNGGEEYAG